MTKTVLTAEQWQLAESPDPVVLEVRNLTKHFPVGGMFRSKHVHALTDVSFAIRRGEVLAVVGESGSGKSTTARLIARLMEPTRGEIFFRGQNVLQTEKRGASLSYRSGVQMIFQDPFGSMNPTHSVAHHIMRPLQIHHKVERRSDLLPRVHELLATVGLNPPADIANKYPHELSGGQRQRVAIARALAVDPEIVLADEPISMLDVSIRIGVLNLMAKLKKEIGIGYLYITHDIASARYFADRIMVLYAGQMMEGADSDELIGNPAHPYTKLLLSAVPNPEVALGQREVVARGEPPSLIDPPPGCPFAARCPQVMDVCRKVMPDVQTIAPNHWVRCHLYGEGNGGTAA
ncbi:ABC transporter ATP-binding protein [Herpetosiphon sp. NSE202]|uniref:ABC transporter ATP-binding protein n=1 Tax=Herpetosiphon sp. NSE202 TaxID=3351349 RepID=UPI00364465C2